MALVLESPPWVFQFSFYTCFTLYTLLLTPGSWISKFSSRTASQTCHLVSVNYSQLC